MPERPEGGNYYPEDMTKEEFETWVNGLSPEEQAQAKNYYTVIHRDPSSKKLYSVPYSEEYKDLLEPAAQYMSEAAEELENLPPLKEEGTTIAQFLRSRADAFQSNDYLSSEVDWLRLSKGNKLEVTIGPYEVYTDNLFAIKAAYECFIHVRDEESSRLLEEFSDLQFVEDNLPVPDKYRNPELIPAPIVVVNQLYAGGDVAVRMIILQWTKMVAKGSKIQCRCP